MADFDFHTAKLVALRRKGNALQFTFAVTGRKSE